MDLTEHLYNQRNFSFRTFGPHRRTNGIIDHIKKELKEIEEEPTDLEEWVDVILLAFDGAYRSGITKDNPLGRSPEEVVDAIQAKFMKNESREWPDWQDYGEDRAIEHKR